MTKETVEVKKDGNTIGTVEVEKFTSIEECITHLGDEKVLKMLNRQRRNEVCNAFRMAQGDQSPAKLIAKIAREVKKGNLSKADGAAKIRELLPKLDV